MNPVRICHDDQSPKARRAEKLVTRRYVSARLITRMPNGLPVSRGGRTLILDDQGAEMLLAVGFTGVLASQSRRGSPTGWSREPRRADSPTLGAPMCG